MHILKAVKNVPGGLMLVPHFYLGLCVIPLHPVPVNILDLLLTA